MLRQQKAFASLIQQRYHGAFKFNEVILSASGWVHNLPQTVEAMFFPSTAPDRQVAEIHAIHRTFAAHYNRSAVDSPPLLHLNLSRQSSPFQLVWAG